MSVNYSKLIPSHVANPVLANIKMNRGGANANVNTVKEIIDRFPMPKIEEHQKYLGPGCYEMPREFDRNSPDTKGNLIVAKV